MNAGLYKQMRTILDSGRTDPGVDAELRALLAQITHHQTEPPPPPLPVAYGSPAWRALPDTDPRKLDAIVDAAESWHAILQSPYATEILAAYFEWDQRRIYSEWSGNVAEQYRGDPPGPSYRLLEQRRAEPAGRAHYTFVERHGQDYTGGPVDWTTGEPGKETAA
ncbi:hypothetical protein ALI144C_44945 [Actinosynnema sp. ALI-1.44]|uniref:DUF2742 domain-containing protein n=1 Tax=Actinosynnema sp. ALI-1.44 TaxID=1933779 RepID=UPI00097BF1C4|nr:DUF2742 domain-containing protein [Actinosynnema sp. ALI-1.44]ONI73101.1 hypothetical protein ALI144C_44945 [Actinosynnema sp. ALI-1.44]